MLDKLSDTVVHDALAPPELAMLAVAWSPTGTAVQDAALVFVHPSIEGHRVANVRHSNVENRRNEGDVGCGSRGLWEDELSDHGSLLKTDETGHACSSHSLQIVGGIASFAVSPIC